MHSSIGMAEFSLAVFAAIVFINQTCLRSVHAYPMLPWSDNEGVEGSQEFRSIPGQDVSSNTPTGHLNGPVYPHNQKHPHHQQLEQFANFPLRHFNRFPMQNFIGEIKRGDLEFEDPRLFSTAFGKRSSSFI